MTNRKKSLITLYFLFFLLIPLGWVTWSSASKMLDVVLLHPADYVIRRVALAENSCKKYGGGATFHINYNGTSVEGRDGCVLWADKGDLVRVYFNKQDLYDNGLLGRLTNLFIGRFVLLLLLVWYFLRNLTLYRQLNTTKNDV